MEFNQGDIVQLKSGGPRMTVVCMKNDGVLCCWFSDSSCYCNSVIPIHCLKRWGDE